MSPRRKPTGPSTAELKMKSDLDQLRRQLKKLGSEEPGAGSVAPAEIAKLQDQLDQLEKTRTRLSKLYFSQLDANRKQTSRLHELLRVVSQISAHLDLGSLLDRVAAAVRDTLGYRIVVIRLREPGTGRLVARAFAGLRPAERAALEADEVALDDFRSWLKDEFRVSRSYFISHKHPFSRVLPPGVVPDLGERQEWEWHPEDVLLTPLVNGDGELAGYVSVDDPADRLVPSREAIELLEVFASHAVVAIENARLYRQLEKRTAEVELANDRLQEMNVLKSQFVSTISHELRTPLTAIRAYVDILMGDAGARVAPEQARHFLGVISAESERLSRLIESVLDLSRFDAGVQKPRREAIDLAGVVEEGAELLRPVAQAGQVVLKVLVPEADTRVDADRDQVRQLVLHLAGNAIKFTPAGGNVTLRLAGDERVVTLSVEDTGIGIPADELEKIFDRFYQVDSSLVRRYGGSGLGLSISKAIVEAHGGRIVASSTPGSGSSFVATFPRQAGPRVLLRPRGGGASVSDDVLRVAVEMVSEAMDARLVSVMSLEPDGDLVVRAALGLDPAVVRDARVRSGDGISGWVAANRRPLAVRDSAEMAGALSTAGRERYRSSTFLSVPLEGEDGLLGVLNVTDPLNGHPFEPEDGALMLQLAERVSAAWRKALAVEHVSVRVEDATDALRRVLEHLREVRQSAPHRVRFARGLAREMGASDDEVAAIGFAAAVHDVGMTMVAKELRGRRDPLDDAQRAEVQRHVELGDDVLGGLEAMGAVREVVLAHHEWWDGSGYPRGLRGDEIPLGARILAVVDAFESMTLGRAHRPPMSRQATLNEIVRLAGSQFDPDVVEVFDRSLPKLLAEAEEPTPSRSAPRATNAGR